MSIKFEKIRPGMTLYDRHKYHMGNTTIRTIGEWAVRIISVDITRRSAVVSWNGNREETYSERQLTKLYDWSMRDDGVEVVRSKMLGQVLSVKRVRKSKASP